MKEYATIELNGLKLDVEFDFKRGSGGTPRNSNSNDPDWDADEIDEITAIKIHGTDICLSDFLEGEMDEQIEILIWDYRNDNCI